MTNPHHTFAKHAPTDLACRLTLTFLFAASLIWLPLLTGCTGSHATVAKVAGPSVAHAGAVLNVMPFAAADKQYATSDAGRRGLAGVIADEGTGIYTYRFDAKDYQNLRQSIVESFRAGKHFAEVRDLANAKEAPSGLRLYLEFSESGMNKTTWNMVCTIRGQGRVEDATGKVLSKKDIAITKKSGMSVSAAKNQAIKAFAEEVGALFNDL
ncbi:MAG TPA: hypothetical protein P5186_27490 [Candidatus Paceibacterota bacterium]|nr:hypothetical protein [Verrucomicrobiota bacterium]HRY51798.1 hypothetical protein [Candidatus Paceibacterota bacterium]